jgi:pimeloyl-ACP methyl ester carboxylesterase
MLASVTIAGLSLRYFDAGGDGEAVVFQHGLAADHTQCCEVFAGVSGLRQITLECRGHGASELGDASRLTIPALADDVLALLDALGVERAWFAGISMGAAIVARLASLHPQRVRGLMLVRPAWFDAPLPPNLWSLTAVAALLERHPLAQARALFLASDSYRAIQADSPDNAAILLSLFDRPDPCALAAVLARISCSDPGVDVAALGRLAVPVTIVANEQDPLHPLATAQRWAGALPAATFVRVPSRSVDRPRHYADIGASLQALCRAAV